MGERSAVSVGDIRLRLPVESGFSGAGGGHAAGDEGGGEGEGGVGGAAHGGCGHGRLAGLRGGRLAIAGLHVRGSFGSRSRRWASVGFGFQFVVPAVKLPQVIPVAVEATLDDSDLGQMTCFLFGYAKFFSGDDAFDDSDAYIFGISLGDNSDVVAFALDLE